jgi:predicted Holliday junction resolvase-like endonuclease
MGTDAGMLNLAIIYGFGLIILALVMALIYNALCGRTEEKALKQEKLEYKLGMEEEHRLAREEERRKFLKEDEIMHKEQERKAYIDETKTGKEGEQK